MKIGHLILSTIGAFVGFILLMAVVKSVIWANTPDQYELLGTIVGVLVICIGVACIGYLSARNALKDNFKQSLYVHVILVFLMFITEVIWAKADLYVAVMRNLGYLVVLQFGAYIFVKKSYPKKSKL